MIYLFVATKSEAQAFVETLGLKKTTNYNTTFFSNTNCSVIVSGVGVKNAAKCSKNFLQNFPFESTRDTLYNIGVAAANKKYTIGEVLHVATVKNTTNSIQLGKKGVLLQTVDAPCNQEQNEIVDMETFGFATILQPYGLKVIKVVSDHFEPQSLTKEGIKKTLKAAIPTLEIFNNKENQCNKHS